MTTSADKAKPAEISRRRLLPPLATALAFLLFAALFCALALMDLSRIEKLLAAVLHHRALATIRSIEQASQERYRQLLRGGDFPGTAGFFGAEEDLSLREALARALMDLARHLDLQDQEKGISAKELESIAAAENLQGIILVNADGQVTAQTGKSPPNLQALAAPFLAGREEVSLHLFEPLQPSAPVHFIGLRRLDGKGAVFLVLGTQGLQFWEWRIAVQETLREFPWGEGLTYFFLETPQNQLLAQGGALPEETLRQCRLLAAIDAALGGTAGRCTLVGEMRILEVAAPFQINGHTIGTARVGLTTSDTDALLGENRRHIFIWTGVMIFIGLLAMVLLFSFQNRYLSRLQAMQDRLHQAERLSSLGRLAAGVAHEIRNPLNAISIAVQRLKREFLPESQAKHGEFQQLTQVVREEISRLNAIVEDFLSLSRSGRLDLHPQPVGNLFHKTLFLVQEEAKARGVQIRVQEADSCPPVVMDLPKMQQVLLNLVKNALESISGEGTITLAAAPAGRDYLCISVADTGKGMSPEEQQRIFDPYYTTKDKGMGLGLAIAHEIVRAHGGDIRVASRPGRGTTFEIFLPAG